nr:hypothetical protein [Legionella jordanis]
MSQEKTELFPLEVLPAELIVKITSYLDAADESQNIKSIRSSNFPLFRDGLIRKNRILARLAQYAAEANTKQITALLKIRPDLRREVLFSLAGLAAQDEMEAILKEHPEDLLVKGRLRDISGRIFTSISVFQHAIWTKDICYMAKMMLDCLPQDSKGEEIRRQLLGQYKELMAKGVAYHLKGVCYESKRQFSLDPLIAAVADYKNKFSSLNYKEKTIYWRTVIGAAQALFPAHIRHYYCNPLNFLLKDLNVKEPKLKRSLQIYNQELNVFQMWNENLTGIGQAWAVAYIPGHRPTAAQALTAYGITEAPDLAEIDILRALDERWTTTDLPELVERLQLQNPQRQKGIECGF